METAHEESGPGSEDDTAGAREESASVSDVLECCF